MLGIKGDKLNNNTPKQITSINIIIHGNQS